MEKMAKNKKNLIQLCDAMWEVKEVVPKTLEKMAEKYFGKAEALDGITDFDKQTIYLSRYLHPHRKGVVFTHEALHVMYDRAGYKPKDEEKSIRAIEHSVYDLILKFPEKYLFADLQASNPNVTIKKVEEVKKVLRFKPKTKRRYK